MRDLLPIPLGAGLSLALLGASSWLGSQSQRRRARRRRAHERWLIDALRALNDLGGQGRVVEQDAPLTAGQFEAVRRLARIFGSLRAPPLDLDPLGAWKLLQGNRSGYSDDSSVGVVLATYKRGAVSLPSSQAGLVEIERLLPPPLQGMLKGDAGLLRSSASAAEQLELVGAARAMDTVLARRGRCYAEFLADLHDKGIVGGSG